MWDDRAVQRLGRHLVVVLLSDMERRETGRFSLSAMGGKVGEGLARAWATARLQELEQLAVDAHAERIWWSREQPAEASA